jgi:hypothetical protein
MTAQLGSSPEENIAKARAALERARALRHSRRDFGVDGICHYVEDVDGNWLEDWSSSDVSPDPTTSQVKS